MNHLMKELIRGIQSFPLFITLMMIPQYLPAEVFNLMTVKGPLQVTTPGLVLPHEHLLVDFTRAEEPSLGQYEEEEAFNVILPYLEKAKADGVWMLIDCTPEYLGRNPVLLQRLSEKTGIHIMTPTGYYAAARMQFLPWYTEERSAEELADLWIQEWKNGIDGTEIRPGLIKLGIDASPLPETAVKTLEAGVIASRETGLTLALHAPDGKGFQEALRLLLQKGVSADRIIWVHANLEVNIDLHLDAAEKGVWIEYDGLSPETLDLHFDLIQRMKKSGYLDQILISHDAGWYSVGEERGGDFRYFGDLMNTLLPLLRESGFSEREIRKLFMTNPTKAFSLANF